MVCGVLSARIKRCCAVSTSTFHERKRVNSLLLPLLFWRLWLYPLGILKWKHNISHVMPNSGAFFRSEFSYTHESIQEMIKVVILHSNTPTTAELKKKQTPTKQRIAQPTKFNAAKANFKQNTVHPFRAWASALVTQMYALLIHSLLHGVCVYTKDFPPKHLC